jgi:hypothetical protein
LRDAAHWKSKGVVQQLLLLLLLLLHVTLKSHARRLVAERCEIIHNIFSNTIMRNHGIIMPFLAP